MMSHKLTNGHYLNIKANSKKIGNTNSKRRREKDKVTEMDKENKKLERKNKELQKEYDEYEDYNERISKIFNRDTIKKCKTKI